MAAATGYDALSHALETLVTTRHTALSECFSRSAWRLINSGFERMLKDPEDLEARGAMLLGAHFGGLAVENSMLGAAHACASPLTLAVRRGARGRGGAGAAPRGALEPAGGGRALR